MQNARIRTLALLLLSAVSGCGDDLPSYSAEGKGAACREQCEALEACDTTVKIDECTESCTLNEAVSRQGQEALTFCIQEQECNELNPVQLLDCVDDALGDLEPSPEGQTFCNEALDSFSECNDSEIKNSDRSDCLDAVSLLTDDLVSDISGCAIDKKACDAKNLCLVAVLTDLISEDSDNPLEKAFLDGLKEMLESRN